MRIRSLFITPPFAVARLGASTTSVECYQWVDAGDSRYDGETSIAPDWTLLVDTDGTVRPYLPNDVTFRDGGLIRPVSPFFEIWARVGDNDDNPDSWTEVPLTPSVLNKAGIPISSLSITVAAFNRKAARRISNSNLVFGTHPPVTVNASQNSRFPILGTSPAGVAVPMIPLGKSIPLGSVQFLKSSPQPLTEAWTDAVNIEVFRFRYWPATGVFYGPPEAAIAAPTLGRQMASVEPANAFLDNKAGWYNGVTGGNVMPGDTYDVIDQNNGTTGPSLGVVDDTCEVNFQVSLQLPGETTLTGRAVAFTAPPDFAPDRRPFLSTADEFNDRSADSIARNNLMSDADLDSWIKDLFERIYETVSLFNVDFWRSVRNQPVRAARLPANKLQSNDLDAGDRPLPDYAFGGKDALRNAVYKIASTTPSNPLPLSEHARMRHRVLSDLQGLEQLATLAPNRLSELIRMPFEVESFEGYGNTSMRMPPLMRQSNALPLTLAMWQYDLVMRWANRPRQQFAEKLGRTPLGDVPQVDSIERKLSESALRRREIVLHRLNSEESMGR